jgi:N12 class adenine-specific DNA methylase
VRFAKNRAAIEKYIELRDEGRPATREEQDILAGYTGWGSFGQELFQGSWKHPRPKAGWEQQDKWLREHLGQEEWEGLQRSITNAHYTDPPTVLAMWDMVRRMGFDAGRILEPGMGVGNFFAMMAPEVMARSTLSGIELDPVTGGIAKLLYPEANISIMGYQKSRTPDDFFDLVIGNWPFENTKIADRRYNFLSPSLHDYYWLKTLDQVRPGGIVIGITSPFTMDKKGTPIRRELAKKGELIAAFRLPSGMFKQYAGTGVFTDIIILRKRAEPLATAAGAGWIETGETRTPAGEMVTINEYYLSHPDHIIGTLDYGHGTTTGRPGMIVRPPADPAAALRKLVEQIPEGVFTRDTRGERISYVANHTADREGALTTQGGRFYVVRGEQLAVANDVARYKVTSAKTTADREAQFEKLIELRRLYGTLVEAERGTETGPADQARAGLKKAYDAFVRAHGKINESFGLSYLQKIRDPFYPALAALEIERKGRWQPATVLSRSTIRPPMRVEKPTITDAFVLARTKAVNPSLDEIAQLANQPAEAVKRVLIEDGSIFETPAGDIVPSDLYLSGNVREKLRQAEAALEAGNEGMRRNIERLQAVVPKDIPYFNIEVQFGATWIPTGVYEQFIAHMLNMPETEGISVTYNVGHWRAELERHLNHRPEAATGFGTHEYPFSKLVNAALSNQTVTIRRKDADGVEYIDDKATEEANARIAAMREAFGDWLWTDAERRVEMEREYNETRNVYATPTFDGSFLSTHGFAGMALQRGEGPFHLRGHQADAIWRGLVSRKSMNAHEVGTGKTIVIAGIAVESRRYGVARKPLVLAHNANSKAVASGIQEMYPAAKVLYIDNLTPREIDVRLRQIANDDWDAIVLPHSLIDRLAFKEETLMEMAREEIEALEEEARKAAADDNAAWDDSMLTDENALKRLRSATAKELVKARNRIIESIHRQAQRSSREGAVAFEDLGIDMVLVDEAHEFKKPPIATRMKMKGLQKQTSNRSIALMFMARYIRAQNNDGNVHLFTGTPVTNTLTEVFHVMRYLMGEEMKRAGLADWDGWFGSFARESADVELTGAGEYEPVVRLRDFINVPELRRMIGQYMDVVFSDDMPEMQPRQTRSGKTLSDPSLTEEERAQLLNGRTENAQDRPYKKVVVDTAEMTKDQLSTFRYVQRLAARWRDMSKRDRRDAALAGALESPVIYEAIAARASFDARMADDEELAGQEGKVPDDPNSKLSRAIRNIMEVYRSDHRATQVVFTNTGLGTTADRVVRNGDGVPLRDSDGKSIRRTVRVFSPMLDMVERLVVEGIPREQIAIVDGSTSKEKRQEVADAMNEGRIRLVIGSTGSLGVGVNMQKNLRAMHHLDAPWMPGDLEQRNGRGWRQGNQWNTVLEYRYITERLDGRRWQVLGIKDRFIKRFLKADDTLRVIEGDAASDEESDILATFAEAAGDPRVLLVQKWRAKVQQLQKRERLHTEGVADARSSARRQRERLAALRGELADKRDRGVFAAAREVSEKNAGDGFQIEIAGATLGDRKSAQEAMSKWVAKNARTGMDPKQIGTFGGHPVRVEWHFLSDEPHLTINVKGQIIKASHASIASLEATIRRYPENEKGAEDDIRETESSIARLDEVAQQSFPRAADLERAKQQVKALEADLAANPVPPPAWLRHGAPVDTDVFWHGTQFSVTGHRWTNTGWFVLGEAEDGSEVTIPYAEATDEHGMRLYEKRKFERPMRSTGGKMKELPPEILEALARAYWQGKGSPDDFASGAVDARTKAPRPQMLPSLDYSSGREWFEHVADLKAVDYVRDNIPGGEAILNGGESESEADPGEDEDEDGGGSDNDTGSRGGSRSGGGRGQGDYGEVGGGAAVFPQETATVPVGNRTLQPVPTVELTRLAVELLGGNRIFVKKYPQARGMFYPEPGKPKIGLNPELGKDYEQFARTLAHEVGHLVDFLPDETTKRGNILGRIGTLRGYMRKTIDELPTDPSKALTPADRKRIRRQAEKAVGKKPPKDEVADLEAWREEVREKYREMIEDEIDARGLLVRERVHEELLLLSEWWRPYDKDAVTLSHQQYRESAPELYADAVSVFLNSPGSLQRRAPMFFHAFMAYMERKPVVQETYDGIQRLLASGPDEIGAARSQQVRAGYLIGEDKLRAAAQDAKDKQGVLGFLKQAFLSRAAPITKAERARVGKDNPLDEAHAAELALQEFRHRDNAIRVLVEDVERLVATPLREAGVSQEEAGEYMQLTRIAEGDRGGLAERAKQAIRDITGEEEWATAKAIYAKMEDYDAALLEQAESGVLNPEGYTPETAAEQLRWLRGEMGAEKYDALERIIGTYRDLLFKVVEQAAGVGVYSKEFFTGTASANKNTYAPFAVLDYFNGTMAAGVRQQVGTVKSIANPFHAALYKAMALSRAVEYQKAKLAILKNLDVDFPGMAGEEQAIDKHHRENRPGPGRANLIYHVDGKVRYREVDDYIVKVLANSDLGSAQRIVNVLKNPTYKILHPLYVTLNLGFQLMNPMRDFRRTQKNIAALTRTGQPTYAQVAGAFADFFWNVPKAYFRSGSAAAAWAAARGRYHPLIRQMLEERALGRPFFSFSPTADDAAYDTLLRQYLGHAPGDPTEAGWKARLKLARDAVETLTSFTEVWSKATAYQLGKARGLKGKALAAFVRNYAGTPDSTEHGLLSDATNSVMLYTNVILAGARADLSVATNPKTAAGYWTSTMIGDVLPKLLMAAAATGLLGALLKDWYDRIPSYDKEKYICVPIPPFTVLDAEGNPQSVYLRIPHDDFNRMWLTPMWALLEDDPNRVSSMLGLLAGEFPGLNTMIELPLQAGQVARGINPYDSFRGRDVIGRREWEAGEWSRWKSFADYTADQFGTASDALRLALRNRAALPEQSMAEAIVRRTPGLKRLVKISNYGLREKENADLARDVELSARVRSDLPREVLRDVSRRTHLQRLGKERRTPEQQAELNALNAWYQREYLPATRAMRAAREEGNPEGYDTAREGVDLFEQEDWQGAQRQRSSSRGSKWTGSRPSWLGPRR